MGKVKHQSVGTNLTSEEFEDESLHVVENIVMSDPPSEKYRVTNLYCIKIGSVYKLVVEHEDVPEP